MQVFALAAIAFVHPAPTLALTPVSLRSRTAVAAGSDAADQLQVSASDAIVPAVGLEGKVVRTAGASELRAAARSRLTRTLPSLAALGVLSYAITLLLAGMTGPVASGLKLIYAGAVAGIISRSACAPLEMVSTVMMCRGDECTSMWDELRKTWKKEGVEGLFRGNAANCLKVAPSRGTQFLVYEFAKQQLRTLGWGVAHSGSLNAGARLCAGGIAGMVAAIIVYPLEVIKTLRTVYPDECKGISLIGTARLAVRFGGGLSALYAGVLPTIVAMFPYVGIEFMVYETLKQRWADAFGGVVSTGALLLIGALAGAAAQASAHPLDVVRRRMQMEGMRKKFVKEAAGGASAPAKPPVKNLVSGLWNIGTNEGWHVLFKGLGPACFEKVPSTAIGYFIYEAMKGAMRVASI